MEDLVGKRATWQISTAGGMIRVEDEIKALLPCKEMTLALMKETNSIVNIEAVILKENLSSML